MNYNNILLLQRANSELNSRMPQINKNKQKIPNTSTTDTSTTDTTYYYDTLSKKKYYILKGKIISVINDTVTVRYDKQEYFYNIFNTKYKNHIENNGDKHLSERIKIIKSPVDEETFTFKYQNLTYFNKQNLVDDIENGKDCLCEFYIKILGYNFTNKNEETVIGLKLYVLRIKCIG